MYWAYSALSRTGETIHGECHCSRQEMFRTLECQSLIVLDVRMDIKRYLGSALKRKHFSSTQLAQFFEDFYNMMSTGVTIPQIILSLQDSVKDPAFEQILSTAQARMMQGDSLTYALGTHKAFPWIVHSTLSAGESSGRLKEAIGVLAQYFKNSADIKARMIQAAMYPVTVFVVLTVIMFFVSLKVVPKLQCLLPPEAMNNSATQVILQLSMFLQKTWMLWLLAIGGGLGWVYYFYQEHKNKLESVVYQVPCVGSLMKESALALYFLNLSVMLKSGVPLMKAISELERSLGNLMSHQMMACRQYMLGGLSFSEALGKDVFFPPVVAMTLRKAEQTAQIDQYCENLSTFFVKRSRARVETLVQLIQPMLLAMCGLFLVLIAFAFLLPIYGSLTKIAGG